MWRSTEVTEQRYISFPHFQKLNFKAFQFYFCKMRQIDEKKDTYKLIEWSADYISSARTQEQRNADAQPCTFNSLSKFKFTSRSPFLCANSFDAEFITSFCFSSRAYNKNNLFHILGYATIINYLGKKTTKK